MTKKDSRFFGLSKVRLPRQKLFTKKSVSFPQNFSSFCLVQGWYIQQWHYGVWDSGSLFSHYCIRILLFFNFRCTLFKFGVFVVKSKSLQNFWGQIMKMRRDPTAAAEEPWLAVKLIPFFNRVLTTTVKNERKVISFRDLNSFCQRGSMWGQIGKQIQTCQLFLLP